LRFLAQFPVNFSANQRKKRPKRTLEQLFCTRAQLRRSKKSLDLEQDASMASCQAFAQALA